MDDGFSSRLIRVHYVGKPGTVEMSLEDAVRLLENIYDGPSGGLVVDARTNEVIYRIDSDTQEISVLEELLGGG